MDRSLWAPCPVVCTFLPPDVYSERNRARIDALNAYRENMKIPSDVTEWTPGETTLSRSFMPAGTMHYCPWWHDPQDPDDMARLPERIEKAKANQSKGAHHLSVHYWTTWAHLRPPIEVVCPDYRGWCVDQTSSNGTGWTVTGTVPKITANPSIWTSTAMGEGSFHGFLRDGVFTHA